MSGLSGAALVGRLMLIACESSPSATRFEEDRTERTLRERWTAAAKSVFSFDMRGTRNRPRKRKNSSTLVRRAGWPVDCIVLTLAVTCAAVALPAKAEDARDVIYECPCSGLWESGANGSPGEFILSFGLRSHRPVESSRLRVRADAWNAATLDGTQPLDTLGAGSVLPGRKVTIPLAEAPVAGEPITWWLEERLGIGSDFEGVWKAHEGLTLWPVSDDGGSAPVNYVDILTDTDSDGVGDVNERIAGTDASDATSVPGASVVDVLALYNDGYRELFRGSTGARIHHVMAVTGATFADSGTNIRFRTVGMHLVDLDADARLPEAERIGLMERYGADATLRFHDGPSGSCLNCARVGGAFRRGYWPESPFANVAAWTSAATAAHELGHVFGLVHSASQGEAWGAFRWSRGHYLGRNANSTVMGYSAKRLVNVFSNPAADCHLGPCGVPADAPGGADAVASLNLVRFQVAAHRPALKDTDGDGIVDAGDALPEDPAEWADADGDGTGDIADTDDDNDGVSDSEDAFPYEPAEWADADGDGIGDNADEDVEDLSPFRDPALRAAVERSLGKAEGAGITAAELATLQALEAPSAGIRNLSGLEQAPNLKSLDLPGNSIRDLSPVAGLRTLEALDLSFNPVSGLSPIAGLSGLRDLAVSVDRLPGADLSALSQLAELRRLALFGVHDPLSQGRHIFDLSPLAALQHLRSLTLWNLRTPDLGPLAQLTEIEELWIPYGEEVTDVSPLVGLARLHTLSLSDQEIVDVSPLAALSGLYSLDLSGNPVADLSPLAEMTGLRYLRLNITPVSDLAPISAIPLQSLAVAASGVSIDEVAELPHAAQLRRVNLSGLEIGDISALSDFASLREVFLADNRISNVSPLAARDRAPLYRLDLSDNEITDIGPLVRRDIWGEGAQLSLNRNPLGHESFGEHIATLGSWGIEISYNRTPVLQIDDPALRALIAQQLATGDRHVHNPITTEAISRLWRLEAYGRGISELAGLDAARNLVQVFLGSNLVSDLGPLAALDELEGLDLANNLISDIGPLVENRSIGRGDRITLSGNPLSEESLNVHVPALRERGVHVAVESVRLFVSPDSRAATFDISGYFADTLGPDSQTTVTSGGTGNAGAEVVDGELRVALADAFGPSMVTITGTGANGARESLDFHVSVRQVVALFPAAASRNYQGFVRVINHSPQAGRVAIRATDDLGQRYEPVTLAVGSGEAVHFNSQDLEYGNEDKGLSGSVGAGAGDWRLDLAGNLDIEVLGYARTRDGFVTTLHDLAPRVENNRTIAILNPGSNRSQASRLRLVNRGEENAEVTVRGVDDRGRSPGAEVLFTLAPNAAHTVTAADIESGADAEGALGDGTGKWRLVVESPHPVYAMSLLESPTGHLTNLSSGPVRPVDATHTVPLFPPVSDPDGRQGFVRVANRTERAGTVTITAIDDSGATRDPVTLSLGAAQTAHFNSEDLELGNAAKGLVGSVGPGSGNWRLGLTADVEIDALGYVRHPDGFLTSMHDAAPAPSAMPAGTSHRIGFFNPGSNLSQVSSLRLINSGTEPAAVTITGRDDRGRSADGPVRVTIPPGAAYSYTAAQLEKGGDDLSGALGDGVGKWRLAVSSDQPISVMSLMASRTGHLANLSTAPLR